MTDNQNTNLAKTIQCLLFTSPETLPLTRLVEILEADRRTVEAGLEDLRDLLADSGLQVVELAGGYQLATRAEYAAFVHRLLQPAPAKLSTQGLEVVAIIAYRQPLTRPEIDEIRGVNSQHAVASLVEKGLVTTIGRKNAPGRPLLYGTTPHFLSSFGLNALEELPNLEALRDALTENAPTILRGVSQTGDEATEISEQQPKLLADEEEVESNASLPTIQDDP